MIQGNCRLIATPCPMDREDAKEKARHCCDGGLSCGVMTYLTSVALHDAPWASGRGRMVPCITGPLTWPV